MYNQYIYIKSSQTMHLFGVAFIVSGILFAIFQQRALIAYFLLTIAVYIGISMVLKGSKSISNRKKIMVATWQAPSEGVIQLKVPCRTEKIQEIVKKTAGTQQKLTITHFAIKALAKIYASSPDMNGKLVFGKFVQHDTIDISCLVDIDGGKDLALVLVKEVDKKSVKQIASFIKQKGSTIKKGKGDIDHKKRTRVADFFPSFLVAAMIQIARFITNKLGLDFKALGLTRHQFGAGCVTSLGMLNFEDATAPFSGFTDCTILLSVNAIRDEPVIQDGKVVPGRVLNCNFVVDHRYVDGGRAKNFVKLFKHVFEHPELYIDSSGPTQAEFKKQKQA